MTELLSIVAAGNSLTENQAAETMHVVMRGESSPEQLAGLLLGVTARGPTVDELVGFARVMREYSVPVRVDDPFAVDLCGTGGDGAGLFNISTAAAFVCAGAGCTVAKHGNRSVSSKSGSADVLEALGVNTALGADGVEYCIERAGIGFIFAPLFHPAMKHVMPTRRALAVRTFFNILGPLCNPAGVKRQLVGAFSEPAAELIARVLSQLGADHVLAVHSKDGLDEISVSDSTSVFEFERTADPSIRSQVLDPVTLGVKRHPVAAMKGSDSLRNAKIVQSVLSGTAGAPREIVAINAAHAIRVAGRTHDIAAALQLAYESIDSGAALQRLAAIRQASHSAPGS